MRRLLTLLLGVVLALAANLAGAQDTTAPTDPREVDCWAPTDTTVDCFWFPSRDNVGVTYRIYRAQVLTWSGGLPLTWTTQTLIGTSTVDGLARRAFQNTGLTAATDYIYWVSAIDPATNESALVNTPHANPTTRAVGTVASKSVEYPASVAPSATITITQTVNCSPACSIGHHDAHWGTSMSSLPNFADFSPGLPAATQHIRSVNITAPASTGNFYFIEDAHMGGTGYPINGAGNTSHTEGMLFRILVTNGSALTITPTTLPNATRGQSYSQTMTASGEGNGVNSWGVSEGRLPDGLTISSAGVISGTPTSSAASSSADHPRRSARGRTKMVVAVHFSTVLSKPHVCQCAYCASISPLNCGEGCSSDFTGLTPAEIAAALLDGTLE